MRELADSAGAEHAARNRALRRLDWRVLIPAGTEVRRVGWAGADELGDALRAVYESVVPLRGARAGTLDLVALANPRRVDLAAAERALRPGGRCYGEWSRPVFRGASGVRGRLRRAGLVPAQCLWTWPPVTRSTPVVWLPPDDRPVVRYYLRSRPRARRRRDTVYRACLDVLWRLMAAAGLVAPLSALAQKPEVVDGAARSGERWLLLTGGGRVVNKVVALRFSGDARDPDAVVKTARVPESDWRLAAAAENIAAVRRARPALAGIPDVLFVERRGDRVSIGETVVRGTPLSADVSPATHAACLERSTDWLLDLADTPDPAPPASWWPVSVQPVLDTLSTLPAAAVEPAQLELSERVLRGLPALPPVPEHRDFGPWNVGVAPSGETVVHDWEGAEPNGLPLLDLAYMTAWLSLLLDGGPESNRVEESYRRAFDPADARGRIGLAAEERYVRALSFEPAAIVPLRLLTWMRHLREDVERARRSGGAAGVGAVLDRNLHLRLYRAQLALVRD